MAYSNFTLSGLLKTFGLTQSRTSLFKQIKPAPISPWLTETLNRGAELVINSEKARSELIVTPILLASRELSQNAFSIYSTGESIIE